MARVAFLDWWFSLNTGPCAGYLTLRADFGCIHLPRVKEKIVACIF
jgi:hypothetical protein